MTTWEQCYGNPCWSSSLGSFQSQVPCPGFFAFLWGSFFREKLWTLLLSPLQPICCHAPTGIYKISSPLGISFVGKALGGSCRLVWTKLHLLLCAWAISLCIFKLRTARFKLLFWTLTMSLILREVRRIQSKTGRAILSSLLSAFAVQLAGKLTIQWKLLFWNKSSSLLLHLDVF